jgi:S-adenosylmethionine:tRNA ribosyltransferase-isomerase
LVYNRSTDTLTHTTFDRLFDFVPKESAVVLNDTKVIKARLFGKKESGGEIEMLLNTPLQENRYAAYIRGRVKVGTKLLFDADLSAEVMELREEGLRVVAFYRHHQPIHTQALFDVLESIGHIPLPPYIKREDTQEDTLDYQSVFAKEQGAVAAPTASLHFTPQMFEALKQRHQTHFLTLHVGAGTFKPVEAEHIQDHVMHSEIYAIPEATCRLIASSQPILAVGTTVTRTVEYYVRTRNAVGSCNLFLHPNNPPLRVNHLLTNFHLPKSTLIMLVASFVGIEKTLALYEEAVKEKYRFFSYGDAMLIV